MASNGPHYNTEEYYQYTGSQASNHSYGYEAGYNGYSAYPNYNQSYEPAYPYQAQPQQYTYQPGQDNGQMSQSTYHPKRRNRAPRGRKSGNTNFHVNGHASQNNSVPNENTIPSNANTGARPKEQSESIHPNQTSHARTFKRGQKKRRGIEGNRAGAASYQGKQDNHPAPREIDTRKKNYKKEHLERPESATMEDSLSSTGRYSRNPRGRGKPRGGYQNYGRNDIAENSNKDYTRKQNFQRTTNGERSLGKSRTRSDLHISESSGISPVEEDGSQVPSEQSMDNLHIPRRLNTVQKVKVVEDDKTQRDKMIEQMIQGVYECMVCCDRIKPVQAIWPCSKCFNSFHLGCIKKWASTSKEACGWRCPACQNIEPKVPNKYVCFCKKLREPTWNRRETPHSCGEICGKKRGTDWCTHKCNILCHPGPCPLCAAFIQRECACKQSQKSVRCSQTASFVCDNMCPKDLTCTAHPCTKKCHTEDCDTCEQQIEQVCFCGQERNMLECTAENQSQREVSCQKSCGKALDCSVHFCEDICHPGDCQPCVRAVSAVTKCPCGKVPLSILYHKGHDTRKSCEDAIPVCGQACDKQLKCGLPGNFHHCEEKCHEGSCTVCPKQTSVRCRCGAMDTNIACKDLHVKADEVTCERLCKRMRQCGRHKCGKKCCIEVDHVCERTCGKMLTCGLHRCEEPCHRGNCPRCWQTSFDELTCHCGASVTFPPVACGTKPPPCNQRCLRERNCDHTWSHACHEGPCPPCTVLGPKKCCGDHTVMKSTPCYVSALSCGQPCRKKLKCGVHDCPKVCHEGKCLSKNKCVQKCAKAREECGHACSAPCHKSKCPETPCKVQITVTCGCGNQKGQVTCSVHEREFRAMATSRLANIMHQNLESGASMDLSQMFTGSNAADRYKRLVCNDECKMLERNQRLALALQITNPETREKLGDSSHFFSEQLKDDAKKDVQFATMVHEALRNLVLLAKESKHKNRSHSFVPMNRDKRRFIHEYSKHFSCESQAYDEEPKKNVVVTAQRGLCCLPPVSVIQIIQKDSGNRRAPAPILNITDSKLYEDRQFKILERSGSIDKKDCVETSKAVDYFDVNGSLTF